MIETTTQYRNQIKRKLRCTPSTKKQLLEKFDSMFNTYREENPCASAVDVEMAFGSSDEMARILMDEITPQEYEQYRRVKTFAHIIAAILLAAFALFTIHIYFMKEVPVEYHYEGSIVETSTLPSPD